MQRVRVELLAAFLEAWLPQRAEPQRREAPQRRVVQGLSISELVRGLLAPLLVLLIWGQDRPEVY